ncbi:MAG: Ig-like domain-containing protein [Gemmatimonas sp.]
MSHGVRTSEPRQPRLRSTLLVLLSLVACGGDDPKVPTAVRSATPTVVGTVGSPVTTIPSITVTDQRGDALAGVWVRWSTDAGKLTLDSSQTNAAGEASVGGWTLGTVAGLQTLSAKAASLGTVTIVADARPGPVRVLMQQSAITSAMVTTPLAAPPSVRASDQYGNPVPNVPVVFSTVSGGLISGAQQTTNSAGVATVGSWTLGTQAGVQTLRVDANGTTGTVSANATSAAAVEMIVVQPAAATGSANRAICTTPIIQIRDQYGNGVGQVPVSFAPAAGSGSVSSNLVTSADGSGYATVSSWTLGSNATQSLSITSPLLPGKQVTVTATLAPPVSFNICARFVGDGGTDRQREAVTKAIARWQRVIVGPSDSSYFVAPANECDVGVPAFPVNEIVSGVLMYIKLQAIDGPGGAIAQAGPCYIHGSNLTLMGFMQFDTADLELMLTAGVMDNVVLHEMGHIFGIGTLWSVRRTLLTGRGTENVFFNGSGARSQFALLGSPFAGDPVPVENCVGISGCGNGTRDSHWRKSVFGTELMQGYVNVNMPMSRVTVASLADLGYQVNLGEADPFSFAPSVLSELSPFQTSFATALGEDVVNTPLWRVQRDGSRQKVRERTLRK